LARFSTAAAELSAALHHFIARVDPLAIVRTATAYLRTSLTRPGVELRSAEHEICARLADLGAIGKQTDVVGIGMVAAHLQAVQKRFKANRMTILAILNTFPHFTRDFRTAPGFLHGIPPDVGPWKPFLCYRNSAGNYEPVTSFSRLKKAFLRSVLIPQLTGGLW
jgi:hypothetical protein